MKKIYLTIVGLLIFIRFFGQSNDSPTKFRRDYKYVSIYEKSTDTWSKWKNGYNTFVINVNDNGDIAHINADGTTDIYRKLSKVEEDYTTEGHYYYQIIKALDEKGNVFKFQIFDDDSIGLKMIYGDVMIQFANF